MAAAQRGSRKILSFVSWRGYIYYTRLLYGSVPGCHVLLGGHLMSFCRRYSKKKAQKIELTPEEDSVLNVKDLKQNMTSALNTLKWEYSNQLTPTITQAVVGNVSVRIDKKQVLLRELAQLGSPDSRTVIVNLSTSPSCVQNVVKELQTKLHLNPVIESSSTLKLSIPKPSKELRENLCRDAKSLAEKAKVTVRRTRQQSIANLRKQKNGISKDSMKRMEEAVQKITDEYNMLVDQMLKGKTEELRKA